MPLDPASLALPTFGLGEMRDPESSELCEGETIRSGADEAYSGTT